MSELTPVAANEHYPTTGLPPPAAAVIELFGHRLRQRQSSQMSLEFRYVEDFGLVGRRRLFSPASTHDSRGAGIVRLGDDSECLTENNICNQTSKLMTFTTRNAKIAQDFGRGF
jgi:hypothetical protein